MKMEKENEMNRFTSSLKGKQKDYTDDIIDKKDKN